jgi:RHS repeat-associated protein
MPVIQEAISADSANGLCFREFSSETSACEYRARYYDPTLGRFLSEDLKRFSEGPDFYSYVRNSPSNFFDPSGQTCTSNITYFGQWLVGAGQRDRFYGPGDPETKEMRDSIAAKKLRKRFRANGCRDVFGFAYGSGEAGWDTLLNPFTMDWCGTLAEVGGFAQASMVNNGDGTASITIPNVSGTHSFFYHLVSDRKGMSGPVRNINQIFRWTEPIGCQCSK